LAISVPDYVRAANIQDPVVRFTWDDWDMRGLELPVDADLSARLRRISQRADVAFALATAEWIVHRFSLFGNDLVAWQFLEAAWAQVVHWRYRSLNWDGDVNPREWSGPVRMPVWRALTLTEFSISEAEQDGSPFIGAGLIASLATHVLADPTPYLEWRDRIMRRLETAYALDGAETLGEVVPREALDPDFDFNPAHTESLVNRFLGGLDYRTNAFLNAPENMLIQGFKGTPYTFDIARDRKGRYEW
jgi:hypothetical protein